MAGAGYKLFNTGDVLTAAQVNTYLQEQAVMRFANATARTTALSGVLAEGMVSYLMDTDSVEVYNGTAWVGVATGDITGITTGATSGLTGGVTSGTADLKFNTTAKGGLLVGTGSGTVSELAVGSNATVLTADSTTATGLKWAAAASGTTYAGCRVFNTTDPSISNNTTTTLSFNSESFDTDAYHSTSTNTSRITIPSGKAGKYFINGKVEWYSNSTGYRSIYIVKNGTSFMCSSNIGADTIAFDQLISMTIDLAVGDYVELHVYQNSGGSLSVYGGSNYTHLEVNYLGA